MSTIIVETQNELKDNALISFLKAFDYKVTVKKKTNSAKKITYNLPITPAIENADFMALAGIWEGRKITIEKLREIAWGGRL
ncbi:MAG: hypothetical protein HY738_18420 [Bacteroidia bacterium]|nr:hypothetical protein [Bacteroidia bacterium]